MHISSASNKKDSTYWNLVRPVPLSKEERRDYVRKDSIGIVHSGKRYLDSIDKAGNKITLGGLLLTGVTFQNRFAKSRLDIPPLGSVLSYNTVEGLAFNPAVTYHKKTSDMTSYSLSTTLRYGFVDRRLNPSASYTRVFNTLDHSILVLSGGSQMSDQNRLRGLDPLFFTYQTLFTKINALKLFEKHFAAVNYSRDITRQFNLGANFEYAGRIPLPNLAYEYITGPTNRHFTANDPYSSPGNGPAFKTNRAATLTLSARLNLGEKFISRPDMLISQGYDYPSLYVAYRKGIAGLFASTSDYDYLSARLSQHDIRTGTSGTFNYSLSGGHFLTRKALTYLDYQPFTNSQTSLIPRADAFEILNAYRYSAADYFMHLHVEQNFMGSIFGSIPIVRKLKLEEIAGAAFMQSDKLSNYAEVYFGVQRLNFRVSYALSFIAWKQYANGLTFTLGGF